MLISRSLPERGQRVLAFGINLFKKNHYVYEAELCGDGQWRTPADHPSSPGDNVELEDVTHWMPMPKAPNDVALRLDESGVEDYKEREGKVLNNPEIKLILMMAWIIMGNQQTSTCGYVTCFIFGCIYGIAYIRRLICQNVRKHS